MKKLTAILLALALLLSFAGCVSQEDVDNAVNDAIAPLNEQIAALNAEITAKAAKIETLESEKSALTAEKAELEADIDEVDAQLATLNEKVAELEASGEADDAEIAKLKGDISNLEEKKTALTDEKTALEASIAEKDTEITNLNTSIETLTAEKQTLSDRIAALEKENETLENEKTELEKENEALKNCLAGNHSYTTYTDNGDGTHHRVCTVCDSEDNGSHTLDENCICTACDAELHSFADGACTACGVTGGYCGAEGENAVWTLKDGAFTLYGTGEVYAYGNSKYPWHDYRSQIESIVVKDGITNIPEWAFYLSKAKTATIPGSVTTIGGNAFYFCYKLETVTLSEGLQTIEYSAFIGCDALRTIHIPASVTYIDSYAFGNELEEITVAEGNAVYRSIDGNLYGMTKYGLTLVRYAGASENNSFVTPAGVTAVGAYAFEGAYNLCYVTFSEDVEYITNCAFLNHDSLTELTILSENIVFEGECELEYCYELQTINFAGTQEQWDAMGLTLPEGTTVNCNYIPYE